MILLSVLAILAIFVIIAYFASRVKGLTFLAQKSTKWMIQGAAQQFCLEDCQTADGLCPLVMQTDDCPLWRFVDANLRTDQRVGPFRQARRLRAWRVPQERLTLIQGDLDRK